MSVEGYKMKLEEFKKEIDPNIFSRVYGLEKEKEEIQS